MCVEENGTRYTDVRNTAACKNTGEPNNAGVGFLPFNFPTKYNAPDDTGEENAAACKNSGQPNNAGLVLYVPQVQRSGKMRHFLVVLSVSDEKKGERQREANQTKSILRSWPGVLGRIGLVREGPLSWSLYVDIDL